MLWRMSLIINQIPILYVSILVNSINLNQNPMKTFKFIGGLVLKPKEGAGA